MGIKWTTCLVSVLHGYNIRSILINSRLLLTFLASGPPNCTLICIVRHRLPIDCCITLQDHEWTVRNGSQRRHHTEKGISIRDSQHIMHGQYNHVMLLWWNICVGYFNALLQIWKSPYVTPKLLYVCHAKYRFAICQEYSNCGNFIDTNICLNILSCHVFRCHLSC